MSIEQAIAENTAALNALAAAVRALVDSDYAKKAETSALLKTVGVTNGSAKGDQAQAAEPEAKAKSKKQAGLAATPEQKEDPAVVVDDVTDAKDFEPVTYDQCAAAITSLAKGKGRAAAVEVLHSFGAEKLPDVKEDAEKLAAIYAAATAALEA